MRTLRVRGNHYEMGLQHGTLVSSMRPLIEEAMAPHLQALKGREGVEDLFQELLAVLRQIASPFLDMIRGQAEGLGMEYEILARYACAFYLESRTGSARSGRKSDEGCTTWAAADGATADGEPILIKNRDTNVSRIPLQLVATYVPDNGYRYLASTNTGSPGVPSSGMNEKGLCVADTRDRCTDYGPGLPYQALMMEVLEKYDNVRSALDFLRGAMRSGGSNLILADALGDMAVFESGHKHCGVIEATDHTVVNANHPVSLELRNFAARAKPGQVADSRHRYESVQRELHRLHGRIDVGLAKRLMASHEESMGPLCRHDLAGIIGGEVATISCAIYLPAELKLLISEGSPCLGRYRAYTLSDVWEETC